MINAESLPSFPPSYSQISSRTQTITTRPARPPSYKEATCPELVQAVQTFLIESTHQSLAPPPSENSGDSQEENVLEEPILEGNFWASNLGNPLLNRDNSRSLLANVGISLEDSISSNNNTNRPQVWKATLTYSIYFFAVAILLVLYTIFLVYINRSPKLFTLIFTILFYIGIGFLVYVCYLILKSFLKRTMIKMRKTQNPQ